MRNTNTNWRYHLYRWWLTGAELIFPPSCPGCGKDNIAWCETCDTQLVSISENICMRCGTPQKKSGVCDTCTHEPPQYAQARSLSHYTGSMKKAILRLKKNADQSTGFALSKRLNHLLNQQSWPIDIIIPVPLGKRRKAERGYNQVSLFARPLAYQQGVRFDENSLTRTRNTVSQIGLEADQRRKNVFGAFSADRRVVRGQSVLLVDDVYTTGSTVNACALALRNAGAKTINVITLARALGAEKNFWEV